MDRLLRSPRVIMAAMWRESLALIGGAALLGGGALLVVALSAILRGMR